MLPCQPKSLFYLLILLYFICVYLYVRTCVCVLGGGVQTGQNKASYHLELELQVIVSHPTWGLDTKL